MKSSKIIKLIFALAALYDAKVLGKVIDNNDCSSRILEQGYKCCSTDCTIIYIDKDGTWGYEDDWCGCPERTVSPKKNYSKCGPMYDNKVCPENQCCSESGECGFNLDFCGKGCQSEFGYCLSEKELENPVCNDCINCNNCKDCHKCNNNADRLLCPQVCTEQQTELPIESCDNIDGNIETDENGYSVFVNLEEMCKQCNKCVDCSKHPEIAEFYPEACKKKSSIISTDGTCGPKYGDKVCPNNECCNENGHCVFNEYQCTYGCQPEYGFCLPLDHNTTCNSCVNCADCDYNPYIALTCSSSICYKSYDYRGLEPSNYKPQCDEDLSNVCYSKQEIYYKDYHLRDTLSIYKKSNKN